MIRQVKVCTVLLSLCVPAASQQLLGVGDIPVSEEASREAMEFRGLVVEKRAVRQQVRKLTKELVWHKKLDDALRAAEQSGKPVLWIHALGKLTGYV